MERPDLLKAGDEVEMSDNIPALRRLTSLHATVKEVKYENSVYTVVAYCE